MLNNNYKIVSFSRIYNFSWKMKLESGKGKRKKEKFLHVQNQDHKTAFSSQNSGTHNRAR